MSRWSTVEVTQDDIDNGVRGLGPCPIEIALRRKTGKWWRVGHDGAVCPPFPPRALPAAADTFMADFDLDEPVKPFTFRLPL